jgi:hypothetical protein
MRVFHAFVLVMALAGCTRENGLFIGDDGGGGGDGGGARDMACKGCDLAGLDLSTPPDLRMPPDLAAMCGASGGCPTGPSCGGICCAAGERCDNGTCHCGSAAACVVGEICATGGPIGGPGMCGTICCGGAGNPCPL